MKRRFPPAPLLPPRPRGLDRIRRAIAGLVARNGRSLIACGVSATILCSGAAAAGDPVDRVLSLLAEERYSEARKVLDPLLRRSPDAPRVRLAHGILSAREGSTDEAIAIFESLGRDHPGMFEPHNNLGVVLAGQGRLDDARRALLAALERKAEPVVYANLGDLYMRLARRAYARAGEPRAGDGAAAEPGASAGPISLVPDAPAAPPASRTPAALCFHAGKFEDRDAAGRAAAWLRSRDAQIVEIRHEKRRSIESYRVYLPAASSRRAAAAKLAELRRRGVRDVAIVGKGPQANAISLGVFKNRANMRRRVAELKKLGYPAVSVENAKIVSAYAIEGRGAGPRAAFDRAWTSRFPGHPVRFVDCPGPR